MDVLKDIDQAGLKEIGVNTYGARHKILKKIEELTGRRAEAVGKYSNLLCMKFCDTIQRTLHGNMKAKVYLVAMQASVFYIE